MKSKFIPKTPWKNLRFRLTALLMISAALLVGAQGIFVQRFQESIINTKFIEKGETLTRLLANSSRLGVFSEDETMLDGPVSAVMGESDVLEVKIYNSQWQILKHDKHSLADELGAYCESEELEFQLLKRKGFQDGVVTTKCKFCIIFWMPITSASESPDVADEFFFPAQENREPPETLGYAYLKLSPAQFNQALAKFKKNAFAATFVFLAALIGLIYYIVAKTTSPLATLVKNVKAGGFTGDTDAEIEFISDSFDTLAETVNKAFESARALKENLEQKVEAKTEALDEVRSKAFEDKRNIDQMGKSLAATIDELKTAQAQLIQAEKMAAMGLLVAGVAHEINNTVNFVSGALPALDRNMAQLKKLLAMYDAIPFEEPGDKLAGYLKELSEFKKREQCEKIMETVEVLLQNIHAGVRQTTKIVSDLRDFSRTSNKRRELVDLNEALDKTIGMLKLSTKKTVAINKDYSSQPLCAFCVKDEISQVMLNLLLNAVQAVADDGTVTVKTWKNGVAAHFTVKDDGVGISSENLQKIFDPFFTTKPVGSGTGLGLGIVYGIVNSHGGKISVSSKEGQGAEFDVSLPLSGEDGG